MVMITVRAGLPTWNWRIGLFCGAAAVWLGYGAGEARAQGTPIGIAACSGGGSDDSVSATGCSVAPYGPMSLQIQIAADAKGVYSLSFTFSGSAGTLTALDSDQPGLSTTHSGFVSGTANITGGTGTFSGAAGSFNYTLNGVGSFQSQGFSISGAGTLTLPDNQTPQTTGFLLSQDNLQETVTQQQLQTNLNSAVMTVVLDNTANKAKKAEESAQALVKISPSSATVPANSSVTLTVTPNIPDALPGTYPGSFTISSDDDTGANGDAAGPSTNSPRASSATSQTVNVSILVSNGPSLQVSQTGMQLLTNNLNSASTAPLLVSVIGSGSVAFTANTSTLSGGGWLSVTPAISAASESSPAALTVSANPGGLAAGTYVGRIDIVSGATGNSPQSVEVVMTVTSPTANLTVQPLQIGPTGLIFTGTEGGSVPAQNIQVANAGTSATGISTYIVYQQDSSWLSVTPSGSSLQAGQSANLAVSVNTAGLGPGLYAAGIVIQEGASGINTVSVGLIVQPGSGGSALMRRTPRASSACVPTQLFPVFTQTAGNFQVQADLPVPLQTQVVDDCGNPLNSGTVVAAFSTGDQSASMMPIGNGLWSGTWLPHNTAGGPATITLFANSVSPALSTTMQLSGTLAANTTTPALSVTAPVVNGASFAVNTPISPGSFVSIFGSNLASASVLQTTLPYPVTLGGTQVLLGGIPMPVEYVGNSQINAIVPWNVPVNAVMQLIVEQGGMSSMPEPVIVSPAVPAVFTSNASGSGQGAIIILKSNGTYLLPGAGTASAGDVLEIYATGLGAVNAALTSGSAAPSSPPAQTQAPVTVTIGGQTAQVGFAGLAPGYAGLYQVNVTVPAGIAPGTSVPIVLTQGNFSSPPVTIGIGN